MEETKKNAVILSTLIAAPLAVMLVSFSFYIFTISCTECPGFDLGYLSTLFSTVPVIIFLAVSFMTSFTTFYYLFTRGTTK